MCVGGHSMATHSTLATQACSRVGHEDEYARVAPWALAKPFSLLASCLGGLIRALARRRSHKKQGFDDRRSSKVEACMKQYFDNLYMALCNEFAWRKEIVAVGTDSLHRAA